MIHTSRMIPLLLFMALLATPGALAGQRPATEDSGTRLIAVKGEVRHQDQVLTHAALLPAQSQLNLGDGATAFALVPAVSKNTRQMAVALAGNSSVQLRSATAEVALLRGNQIAFSGVGTLLVRGFRIELQGSLLFQDYRVYVTHGRAFIGPADIPQGKALSLTAKVWSSLGFSPRSTPRPEQMVQAGQAAQLALGGEITVAPGEPPTESQSVWSKILVPPPWTPANVGTVSPGTVAQAQKWTRQQLQAQRETASCGCTESSGSGGPAVGSGVTVTKVERTNTMVRVQITGMPRRIE